MTKKEFEELQEKVRVLTETGEEMGKEILHLRRSNAGLKGNNAVAQNAIKELTEKLKERERVINGQQEQVLSLRDANVMLKHKVSALEADKEYFESLSWWGRLMYRRKE